MKEHQLRKKELREVEEFLRTAYPKLHVSLGEVTSGLITELEDVRNMAKLVILNDVPALIELSDGSKIPTLVLVKLSGLEGMQYVVVDEGAVKYVLNGADVMAPGITMTSDFRKGELVSVWSPTRESPLCVGRAIMSSDEITTIRKGRAVENIHHAGDRVWKICLERLARKTT